MAARAASVISEPESISLTEVQKMPLKAFLDGKYVLTILTTGFLQMNESSAEYFFKCLFFSKQGRLCENHLLCEVN